MGMQDYPNSGYLIEWDIFKKNLPFSLVTEVDAILESDGVEEANEKLKFESFASNSNMVFELFSPNDECNVGDTMEHNKVYVLFDQSELFELKPTELMIKLRNENVEPRFEQWTTWG
jgi:hypothetical protein